MTGVQTCALPISFIDSVNDYNRTCSCRPNEKGKKYKNCNDLYISIVTNEIEPLKNMIFEKITDNNVVFYFDSKAILTLTR